VLLESKIYLSIGIVEHSTWAKENEVKLPSPAFDGNLANKQFSIFRSCDHGKYIILLTIYIFW